MHFNAPINLIFGLPLADASPHTRPARPAPPCSCCRTLCKGVGLSILNAGAHNSYQKVAGICDCPDLGWGEEAGCRLQSLTLPVQDYLDIFSHFMTYFGIDGLTGLSTEAMHAQEDTCVLLQRFRKVAERRAIAAAKKGAVSVPFSWVYGREILLPA